MRDDADVPVVGARVVVGGRSTTSDAAGAYLLVVPAGQIPVEVTDHARRGFTVVVDVTQDRELDVKLGTGDNVMVHAEQDMANPDPSTKGCASAELLQANPGRPGAPFSIPGLPVETASGGIKAPQYFSPGVPGESW